VVGRISVVVFTLGLRQREAEVWSPRGVPCQEPLLRFSLRPTNQLEPGRLRLSVRAKD